jgi:hypothetical protein
VAEENENNRYRQENIGTLVPRPDPTLLTTEQLRRELAALRELLETRLDDMDKATELLSATVNRTPTEVDKQITHLRELQDQKFQSIALQFIERDARVEAALQSAKELVTAQNEANTSAATKTEASFTKQIDQTGAIISTLEKTMDVRITELKERLDRGEGGTAGAESSRNEFRANWGLIVGIATAAASITALITHFLH